MGSKPGLKKVDWNGHPSLVYIVLWAVAKKERNPRMSPGECAEETLEELTWAVEEVSHITGWMVDNIPHRLDQRIARCFEQKTKGEHPRVHRDKKPYWDLVRLDAISTELSLEFQDCMDRMSADFTPKHARNYLLKHPIEPTIVGSKVSSTIRDQKRALASDIRNCAVAVGNIATDSTDPLWSAANILDIVAKMVERP